MRFAPISIFSILKTFSLKTVPILAIILATLHISATAAASELPNCSGKNYLDELAANDPEAFVELRRQADSIPNSKGIFWKIEHEGRDPSYLLGTMHVSDSRIVAMPAEAGVPFEEADTLALELDSFEPADVAKAMFAYPELTTFTDGRSLKNLLDVEELKRLERALKTRGIPLFAVEKMKPWLLMIAFSMPECELKRRAAGLVPLDLFLLRTAQDLGKNVVGLETMTEQLQSLSSMPAVPLLRSVLAQLETGRTLEDFLATTVGAYLAGDIAMILPASYRMVGMEEPEEGSEDDPMKYIIVERNVRMASRAQPLLEDGNAFIAVGALHLIGEQGLVELFRKQGYSLTRLH